MWNRLSLVGALLLAMIDPAQAELKCFEADPKAGRSLAVVVGSAPLVHTTQLFPLKSESPTEPAEQVHQVFQALEATLKGAGSQLSQVVKLNVYVAHPSVTAIVEQQLAMKFTGTYQPAVSFVTTPLPDPAHVVALDAVAMGKSSDQKQVQRAETKDKHRPARFAVLPAGPRVYISGQLEKGDGSLADGTRETMKSLFRTLEWLGLTPDDVVEIKAFLTPMKNSAIAIAEMVKTFGDQTAPPISVVEWLAAENSIEIELVAAARPRDNAPACEYLTPSFMTASPVYCRVVRADAPESIYFSGLYGSTTEPNSEAELRELFAITERLAAATGSDLKHLVKATYYVSDNEANAWHNKLRPEYYDPARPPAASKAMVHGVGRDKRTITWDMIAVPKTR